MNTVAKIREFLSEQKADETLLELVSSLVVLLPHGVEFEQNTWNLLEWKKRKGRARVYNLNLYQIKSEFLRAITKLYILDKRNSLKVEPSSLKAMLSAIVWLDKALGPRSLNKASNGTFYEAQGLIAGHYKDTVAARMAGYLQTFGDWLCANLGLRISYRTSLKTVYDHGREATDKQKDDKLIDSRILVDLVAANQREDLIRRDQFYLSVLTIFLGTGFRINEIATLPRDCLVQEGDNVGIRFFPEKKPRLDTRWLLPEWIPAVKHALEKLVEMTEQGREAVRMMRPNPGVDWSRVIQDEEAAQYFVAKFCHEWTANSSHDMYCKEGAWLEKEKRYVDVLALVNEAGSQVKAAKQLGIGRATVANMIKAQHAALRGELPPTAKSAGKKKRASWDTDSRVISVGRFIEYASLAMKPEFTAGFSHIIDKARDDYQLQGRIYPCPPINEGLEDTFRRRICPVIESEGGRALLQPEDALLIVLKYQLSDARSIKKADYSLITDSDISRWLCGEKRSLGTKKPEDSCFSRLEIIDPNTREIAKFVSHDIRHWLTTYLLEGGMPSDQVALLFNRTDRQNDVYDQTSSRTRLQKMREAIRSGGAMGHVADNYQNIAEYSRQEAEQYLEASTLQLNLMPHGGCSLNWGMKACPNHNGCFNGDDGPCEYLCIDSGDPDTNSELMRMKSETEIALQVIPEQSPQYGHYQNVLRNLRSARRDDHA